MKVKALMITLLISICCFSQKKTKQERQAIIDAKKEITKEIDTLTTSTGFKVYKGLKLKIGVGSTNDGNFKFIRRNNSSLFNYYSTKGYATEVNAANALPREYSGLEYEIKSIENRGNEKHGYKKYVIIRISIVSYEIDLENAIKFNELEVSEQFKFQEKNEKPQNTISIADELLKMKSLYDNGILTKEEYEIQKKKLLDK